MGDISVIGYDKDFPMLDLKLKKEDEFAYDFALIDISMRELAKGFGVRRINKTTKKGTTFKFDSVTSLEQLNKCITKIEEDLKVFNEKHNETAELKKDLLEQLRSFYA
jgi:hypothetical protein